MRSPDKLPRARASFFSVFRFLSRASARFSGWLWAMENGSRAADRAKANRPWVSA